MDGYAPLLDNQPTTDYDPQQLPHPQQQQYPIDDGDGQYSQTPGPQQQYPQQQYPIDDGGGQYPQQQYPMSGGGDRQYAPSQHNVDPAPFANNTVLTPGRLRVVPTPNGEPVLEAVYTSVQSRAVIIIIFGIFMAFIVGGIFMVTSVVNNFNLPIMALALIVFIIGLAFTFLAVFLAMHGVRFTSRGVEIIVCNIFLGKRWIYKTYKYSYEEIEYLNVRYGKNNSDTVGSSLNMVLRRSDRVIQLSMNDASEREKANVLNFLDQHTVDGYGTQFHRSDPRELVIEGVPGWGFLKQLHIRTVEPINAPPQFIQSYEQLATEINAIMWSKYLPIIVIDIMVIVLLIFAAGIIPGLLAIALIIAEVYLRNKYMENVESLLSGILQRYNMNEFRQMGLSARVKVQEVTQFSTFGGAKNKIITLIVKRENQPDAPNMAMYDVN